MKDTEDLGPSPFEEWSATIRYAAMEKIMERQHDEVPEELWPEALRLAHAALLDSGDIDMDADTDADDMDADTDADDMDADTDADDMDADAFPSEDLWPESLRRAYLALVDANDSGFDADAYAAPPEDKTPPESQEKTAPVEDARPPVSPSKLDAAKPKKPTLDERALALFLADPTRTKATISVLLGLKNPQSLSPRRCPKLATAVKAYRAENARAIPRGSKGNDGGIEAYD
jgi:hypothetical protein